MAVTVTVELEYEFEVKASAKEAFDLLANVPESASHYPKVDKLIDLGDGVYRWEMAKIGVGSAYLQTIYASKYVSDKAKGSVVWSPIQGEGNAQVSGNWKITAGKKSTKLALKVNGDVSVPLPALMKMVVAPIVKAEFEKMTQQYVANLTRVFGGEA